MDFRKLLLIAPAVLSSTAALAIDDATYNAYFDARQNPALTKAEVAGLDIARQYNKGVLKPVAGRNGSIVFSYGSGTPSIEPGERVNSINIGDTARWLVEPAMTGTGELQQQHLIIKPLDVGLNTTMVVATDRRAYHIKLKSHKTSYMPLVTFSYPEDLLAKWQKIETAKKEETEKKMIPQTGENLDALNFNYTVEGSAAWKPVRVYSTSRQTIIQLPASVKANEMPTLLVLRNDSGRFDEDNLELVNYRVRGDRMIVDQLFKHAVLIAGVGSSQDRVTIKRNEEGK